MSYDTAFAELVEAGWPEPASAEIAQITIELQAKQESETESIKE